MKAIYSALRLSIYMALLFVPLYGQNVPACNVCLRTDNPALLPRQLRERCAKGYPLAFTKLHYGPWWPQDPRYPNWDYYYWFKEPRPDMGFGITPK